MKKGQTSLAVKKEKHDFLKKLSDEWDIPLQELTEEVINVVTTMDLDELQRRIMKERMQKNVKLLEMQHKELAKKIEEAKKQMGDGTL